MTLLFEQLLNGLQFGAMLFLLAAGLTLIFGIMGVINLAHGSFYMLGAYVSYSLVKAFDSHFWLGVLIAPVVVAVIGYVVERRFLRYVYHLALPYQLLLTFAFAHCETVCPLLVTDVVTARRRLAGDSATALIVTLDPYRDVPARLPSIARRWGLGPEERVLSGPVAEVERVLEDWGVQDRLVSPDGGVWLANADAAEIFDIRAMRPPLEKYLQ